MLDAGPVAHGVATDEPKSVEDNDAQATPMLEKQRSGGMTWLCGKC